MPVYLGTPTLWTPLPCTLFVRNNHMEYNMGNLMISLSPERVKGANLLIISESLQTQSNSLTSPLHSSYSL